ncbi:MAG: SMP-30/gluconolactonase/LRE family protein [Candidatus Methylacidiphilales bacterium]
MPDDLRVVSPRVCRLMKVICARVFFLLVFGFVPKLHADPQILVLAEGFAFPEGPVLLQDGTLLVCDVPTGTIYSVDPAGGGKEVWLKFDGEPNGACLAPDGRVLVADRKNKRIRAIDPVTRSIADVSPPEASLHSPNDVGVSSEGVIFFTDPTWKRGWREIPQYVWRVDRPDALRSLRSFLQPNGLKVFDQKLFVAEGATGVVWVADLGGAGQPEFRPFFTFQNVPALDGMEAGPDGRLFVALFGASALGVISTQGEDVGRIQLPGKNPTNVTISPDGKNLFVTEAEKKQVLRITGF